MKTPMFGLMLSMLAISGLFAGALFATQANAQLIPINTATSSNEDNDDVKQTNVAKITQKSETKCDADASSANVLSVQAGDNTNTAANDCDTTQTADATQANVNTDNDVQVATSEACQAVALLISANVCGNTAVVDGMA